MLELQSTLAPWTPLSTEDMRQALLARLYEANRFGDERATYIGASEIGGCQRQVAHKKLYPELHAITDPEAAGRIQMGKVAENEVVQVLRLSPLGKWIRDTGVAQAEIAIPDAPIRVHPDGTILRLPVPDGQTHAVILGPDGKLSEIEIAKLEGPGNLEVKTYGVGAFGYMRKKGLNPEYLDQVQIQMGSRDRKWTLLIAAQRENVSKTMLFIILFDPARYEALKAQSRATMAAVEAIRNGADEQAQLPAPDKERGYCDSCPLFDSCPAHLVVDAEKDAVFPPEVALEVEVLAEEFLELEPAAKRLKDVKEALRDLFAAHPVETHIAEGIKATRRYSNATTQCRFEALKTKYPDAFNDSEVVYTTEPALWVAVSVPKAKPAPKGKKGSK